MGNDFFRFKQFEVKQGKAAMKVCTDACLFGALLPVFAASTGREMKVLDIGTGTGLLSLMYAQRQPGAQIDALELDGEAFVQAKENFSASPWSQRIFAIRGDFRTYYSERGPAKSARYDLIFSNPPFFDGDLKSADNQRDRAMHSTDLNFGDLLEGVEALLQSEGLFAVLIPFARRQEMIAIAGTKGLFPCQEYVVAHTERHDYFRVIQVYSRREQPAGQPVKEILIRDLNQQYSLKFRELLSPFYLYL